MQITLGGGVVKWLLSVNEDQVNGLELDFQNVWNTHSNAGHDQEPWFDTVSFLAWLTIVILLVKHWIESCLFHQPVWSVLKKTSPKLTVHRSPRTTVGESLQIKRVFFPGLTMYATSCSSPLNEQTLTCLGRLQLYPKNNSRITKNKKNIIILIILVYICKYC